MKTTLLFMKISMIVKNLFDKKSGSEIQSMKQHFAEAYSDAQLFALVFVGMLIRVFGLAPEAEAGSRSLWSVVGLFAQFLKSLDNPPEGLRAAPNPLDEMVADGVRQVGEHG